VGTELETINDVSYQRLSVIYKNTM